MDTIGPKMSRSLLFWLVLVLPLLADTAVGASVTKSGETGFTGGKYAARGRKAAMFRHTAVGSRHLGSTRKRIA